MNGPTDIEHWFNNRYLGESSGFAQYGHCPAVQLAIASSGLPRS
jgi:hypothetical protein